MVLFVTSLAIGPWNGDERWSATWTHGEILGTAELTTEDDVDGRFG
jgi:hypothetical protein